MARKSVVKNETKKAERPVEPKTTAVVGDLDDLMAATAVNTVAAKKPAKKEVEDVHLADPAQKAKLALLLRYSARKAAAEARAEGLKGQLRPIFEELYFNLAHANKAFLKTVCVDDACNYSAGNVGVAGVTGKDETELKANFAKLRTALTELFGPEGYKKYVMSTSIMQVKMTKENLAVLQAKLTPEEFAKVITYVPGLAVTEEEIGKEKIIPLKRDMSVDPAVEAVVRKGVALGILTLSNGAVTPQKTALAVVEEELLKEEQEKDESAAAKAAGMSVGAMAGAMVEAAVVTVSAGSH
jgi:hypothetical protein